MENFRENNICSLDLNGRYSGSVVSLLQQIQEKYNYLPEEILKEVSKEKDIPLIDLYSVATFYKAFSLTPKGKHKIVACTGTACHVRGSDKVIREISRKLGIEPGETTKDGMYSLENVNCLGACALAPLVVIDENYYGNMNSVKILEILQNYTVNGKGGCHGQAEGEKEKLLQEKTSC